MGLCMWCACYAIATVHVTRDKQPNTLLVLCHPTTCAPALLYTAALERSSIDPAAVNEVFMGNVCSANVGQVRQEEF